MSKKIRDSIFIIFIIIFLIMTVIVSLYASGYRFNLSWPLKMNRFLQKTGMLAVATEPSQAAIYLDDKPQNNSPLKIWKRYQLTTPAKIKNLLPGEYELRLEADGYWPFKQKIYINSGETTFIEDVNLFRADLPLLVLAGEEDRLSLSPDKKYLYSAQAGKIITIKTGAIRILKTGTENGIWLDSGKLFAGSIIFDPVKIDGDTDYSGLISKDAANLRFEEDGGRLYYQYENSINRLESDGKTITKLLDNNKYLDYLPSSGRLFTITDRQGQIKLEAYSLENQQFKNSWPLPANGSYVFTTDIPGRLAISDNRNRTLYLFAADNIDAGPIVIRGLNDWALASENQLIYATDFEIYTLDLSSGRTELITRRSGQIKDIIWNKKGNYLIFSESNTINVLDFKNRNATPLFKTEKIASPILDEKNDILYFWARIGQQEGIYELTIQ